MLYSFVRPLAVLTLKAHFRKIYLSKVDQIPEGHPVILAVNHPTAFIEPCLMACFQPHTLHFLVRGGLFKNFFARTFLEALNMIPIFRLKDGGYAKLKENYSTFERCYDALNQNKALMILAEGSCEHEKRLRPIRKGTARIAFGAYDKYQIKDIRIVPIGVNYTFSEKPRTEVMMEVGETICLEDYLDLYNQQPQAAIRKLTQDIFDHLEPLVIIIEEEADEALAEQLFELYRNNEPFTILPILEDQPRHLHREKALATFVNQLPATEKAQMKKEVNGYFAELEKLGLSDFGVVQAQHYNFNNTLTLIVGIIPFVLGVVGNFLPLAITRWVANTFVKTVEFKQSVKVSAGLGFYIIYFCILLFLCWQRASMFWLVFLLMIPLWGYFSLLYWELWQRWTAGKKVQGVKEAILAKLRLKRRAILLKNKAMTNS